MLDLEQIRAFYPEPLRPFGRALLREYLQYKILEAIAELPVADRLRFMGGTCIHMVHASPRFSEDLDFDNLDISAEDFLALCRDVRRSLQLDGLRVECATSLSGAFTGSLSFPGLLHEQGLSGHPEEKLLIKVDTEPQRFEYTADKVVLSRFDALLRINVVPVDVLLAQKMHAALARKRAMGRDFYDVVHLMGRTTPSMAYVQAKIGAGTREELRDRLLARWRALDTQTLVRDVSPFLPVARDIKRVEMFAEVMEAWRPRHEDSGPGR